MVTEAKTVLAGAIGETFFARLVASIAAFNAGTAPSGLLGCWDSAFMVGTRGGGERTVWREGCEDSVPEP
jgi:hypothetical protein